MIPVLYKANATDFTTYGLGALAETVSCKVTEERNGAFECVLQYPSSGRLYAEIKKDRIIKAKPNDTKSPQAFRIYKITTPINGIITISAQHISYDLTGIGVMPFSIENAAPAMAIQHVLDNATRDHDFTFRTDYSEGKDFSVEKPKSIRACLGGESGSLLSLWGGEFEWDNFQIIHHQGRGEHTDVVIEYGKNMTKLNHESDDSSVYTDLLPFAVISDPNGEEEDVVVTLPEQTIPIVDSALLTSKTLILDLTDKFGEDEEITEETLRAKASDYIRDHPLGVETSSITVSFEPLWKQPEYAAVLERVSLCDTVTIRHSVLGITAKSKVIKTDYDVLAEKYNSITLGSSKANLTDKVSETESEIEKTNKAVDRFPTLLNSAIKNATDKITGQTGGYVVLNTHIGSGEPYELLILDSPNLADAVNVWRWNVGGLGFSSHGYNGPYETAITADGQIVADFITAGSLVANIIKAGVLSSQDGSSYWNLETGEVVLRAYATTSSVESVTERVSEIEDRKMLRLVITSSNGNIFKNGQIATILTATVFSWDENITDTLDPNQFIWTRVSDDEADDFIWNQQHFGGTKQVEITSNDVKVRATFFCDLIDTTTRKSLLG